MWEVIFIGGFFAGIFSTLLTLAVLELRWSKSRKAKERKKRSAHGLAVNRHFQSEG